MFAALISMANMICDLNLYVSYFALISHKTETDQSLKNIARAFWIASKYISRTIVYTKRSSSTSMARHLHIDFAYVAYGTHLNLIAGSKGKFDHNVFRTTISEESDLSNRFTTIKCIFDSIFDTDIARKTKNLSGTVARNNPTTVQTSTDFEINFGFGINIKDLTDKLITKY
jgi:hypothetical protein